MARRGLAAVLAAIPIALTSCSTSALTSAQVPPPVTVPASSPAGAPGTCTAGYCVPADWDTARASTPLPQVPPFSEPLNVIVSARSTVTLAQVQQALGGNW
jgi:hypothetical protein